MDAHAIFKQAQYQRELAELLYSHRDPGILGFAADMSHPLSFLSLEQDEIV